MEIMRLVARVEELERRLASLEKYRPLTRERIAGIEAEYGRPIEDIFRDEAARGELSLAEFAESLGITRNQARYWCDRLGVAWQRTEANRRNTGNPALPCINRERAFLKVTVGGETMTLADYCRREGVSYRRIYSRMYRHNLTADEAIRYQPKANPKKPPAQNHPWRLA